MFFDIGANNGQWTIANLNNTNKIIAVEASFSTFEKLKQNLEKNTTVELLNYAICNNNMKPITFYHCTDADTLSTINSEWLINPESRFYNYKYRAITVNTMTIDKMIELYGMPILIKIDVECGEYDCIKSLTQKTPELCFEWASEMKHIAFLSVDYLYSLGYTQFHLQYEDNYVYRPNIYNETLETIKIKLQSTHDRIDWGMIWCK